MGHAGGGGGRAEAAGGEPSNITEFLYQHSPGPFGGGRDAWPLQEPQVCPVTPIILLSWFDGIGTAAHALHTLGARVVHHVTWEIDCERRAFLAHNWPHANLRGSFYGDAFEVVLNQVTVGLAKAATAGGPSPPWCWPRLGPLPLISP